MLCGACVASCCSGVATARASKLRCWCCGSKARKRAADMRAALGGCTKRCRSEHAPAHGACSRTGGLETIQIKPAWAAGLVLGRMCPRVRSARHRARWACSLTVGALLCTYRAACAHSSARLKYQTAVRALTVYRPHAACTRCSTTKQASLWHERAWQPASALCYTVSSRAPSL